MKQKIRMMEYNAIQYFLIRSCFVGIAAHNVLNIARQDSWMCFLMAIVVGFIPLFLYLYLMNKHPDLNLFDMSIHIFGKRWGKIINFVFFLFVCSYCVLELWNFSNFVVSQYLYRTPTYFISFVFLIVVFYALNKGFKTFSQTCLILFYLSVFLYTFSAVGLLGQVQYDNVLPSFEYGVSPIVNGVYQVVSCNVFPLFLLTIIPKNQIIGKQSFQKRMIIFYLITLFMLFIVVFTIQTVFGIHMALLYQYPEFQILKRVTIVGFLERMESVFSFQWVLDMLMTLVFTFYVAIEYIYRVFEVRDMKLKNGIIILFCLACLIISEFILPSHTHGDYFFIHYFPHLLSIGLFLIPLMMVVVIWFRKRKNKYSSMSQAIVPET